MPCALDGLLAHGFDGQPVRLLVGVDGTAYSSFAVLLTGTVEQPEFTLDEVRFRIRDRQAALSVPVSSNTFAGTGGLEGTAPAAGQYRVWLDASGSYFRLGAAPGGQVVVGLVGGAANISMESIRCGKCGKLLAKTEGGAIEIKCPRCGTLNHVRATSPSPERRRASTPEDAHDRTQDR